MSFKKKIELPEVEPVKIKPLFGMKPGLWLSIVYLILILLLIFLIGFLPGILNGRKRVTFTSEIGNAAVSIDGAYAGGTPFTAFVQSGTHTAVFSTNEVVFDSVEFTVGHPVFFTWLFPRSQAVESSKTLTKGQMEAVNQIFLSDIENYSKILSYDNTHRYRPLFSDYAAVANASGYDASAVVKAASAFITTEQMLQDAQDAFPSADFSIPASVLAEQTKTTGQNKSDITTVAKASVLKADSFSLPGFEIEAASFSNGQVVSLSYPEVSEAGKEVSVASFNIGATCISEYLWALFIQDNPSWAVSNKESLIEQGLVDEYYLSGVTVSASLGSARPVRNVSVLAARAFCTWLSEKTGRNVYLPSEEQWIAAALSDTEGGYQKSIMAIADGPYPAGMLGGLWEMTDTVYVPLSRLMDVNLSSFNTDNFDVVVKGGSYVNSINEISIYTVGTTSVSRCSDYQGFRVAWD